MSTAISVHVEVHPVERLEWRLRSFDAVVCVATLQADATALTAAEAVLSASERVRYAAFTNVIVARRFAIGRLVLRSLLGELTARAPADVDIRLGPHGKPELATGSSSAPLWFSVAHSEELFAVALSRRARVGLDVERTRAIAQWERVADRVLAPSERASLGEEISRGSDAASSFLQRWCCIEAELKASGLGIQGLDQHRASGPQRGMRVAPLEHLPLPPALARTGAKYQGAVALWDGRSIDRAMRKATTVATLPMTSPATASTP